MPVGSCYQGDTYSRMREYVSSPVEGTPRRASVTLTQTSSTSSRAARSGPQFSVRFPTPKPNTDPKNPVLRVGVTGREHCSSGR